MRASFAAALLLVVLGSARAADTPPPIDYRDGSGGTFSLVVRDAPLREVFEMLARRERASILVSEGVDGRISLSLFDVRLDAAVRTIAEAAGFVAERRRGAYVIVATERVGKESAASTRVQSFKIQYSDPQKVSDVVGKYLSRYGEVTVFADRRMLVVEDLPDFIARIAALLAELDREPRQVLIQTRILEITLNENDVFGIDWEKFFSADDGDGSFGVRGQTSTGEAGLFFELITPNIEAALNALSEQGRVRTLSTPSVLALEYEPAEVVIGDRLGYRVTTTINQVTSESVEFLESGVILRFTAAVDRLGRVMLEIHPEVSTGVISDGLPNQTTAEVTTRLLVEDGEKIFIGGLIKDRASDGRSGVPVLGGLPGVGWLFSRRDRLGVRTETVVIATAYLADSSRRQLTGERAGRVEQQERPLQQESEYLERVFESEPNIPYDRLRSQDGTAAPEAPQAQPAAGTER